MRTRLLPSTCTMLVCGAYPSRTWRRRGCTRSCADDLDRQIVDLLEELGPRVRTIVLAPDLRRAGRDDHVLRGHGVARRAATAPRRGRGGSMSTMICRCLPPYGQGSCGPGGDQSARMKLMP